MTSQSDIAERMKAAVGSLIASLRSDERVGGVPVGDAAPAFTLPNAVGDPVSLDDRLAAGPVVVVFYRGGWCPFCDTYLRALQQVLPDIRSRGASLVAITPEPPDTSLSIAEKLSLGFDVVSDLDQSVADAYRLRFDFPDDLREIYEERGLDLGKSNADGTWRLPVPGTFVIDRAGVVRARHVDPNYRERMDVADLLAALDDLD